jgi:hypothetical protein
MKNSGMLLMLIRSYWGSGVTTTDHVPRATVEFVTVEMTRMTRMTRMMKEIMVNPIRREGGCHVEDSRMAHQNRLPNLTKQVSPLPANSVPEIAQYEPLPANSVPEIAQYEPRHLAVQKSPCLGILPERGTEAANVRHLLFTIDLCHTVTAKDTLLLSVQQTTS